MYIRLPTTGIMKIILTQIINSINVYPLFILKPPVYNALIIFNARV